MSENVNARGTSSVGTKGRQRKNEGWAEEATDEDEDNSHCEASKTHIASLARICGRPRNRPLHKSLHSS